MASASAVTADRFWRPSRVCPSGTRSWSIRMTVMPQVQWAGVGEHSADPCGVVAGGWAKRFLTAGYGDAGVAPARSFERFDSKQPRLRPFPPLMVIQMRKYSERERRMEYLQSKYIAAPPFGVATVFSWRARMASKFMRSGTRYAATPVAAAPKYRQVSQALGEPYRALLSFCFLAFYA